MTNPAEEPEERDPYAECRCGHGRHAHARYTGACGLCDCVAVRPAPTGPEMKPIHKNAKENS